VIFCVRASLQASALEELRRLVAFMNHSVAAAATATPISTPTPKTSVIGVANTSVFDGTLLRSPATWPGHASPGKKISPADPGDSTNSAGTLSYDEDDDEGLSLST